MHTGPKNIEDVVKNFIVRYFRLPALGLGEAGLDEGIELVLSHFPGQLVVTIRF